ncbi:hypothetical protein BJI48_07975 [Helicobacter sp. 11S02596-1]|nr:hypothetical protein BJI48_07975 [Helicobacter sp. 11S02596-1]
MLLIVLLQNLPMESIKIILSSLEKMIASSVVSLIGMLSYLFINSEKLPTIKIIFLIVGMVIASVLSIILAWIFMRYLVAFKKMEMEKQNA